MSFTKAIAFFAAVGFIAAPPTAQAAAVTTVVIDDTQVFPESITSTQAGDLIIGSAGKGAVYRAKAGSDKATRWLDPAKTGMANVLGVFADDRANTLYVCSAPPAAPPGTQRQSQLAVLRTFDLQTGAPKASYPMIDQDKATCNDIDVAADGTAYVADTGGGQILRLKKGASALEVWIKDDRLAGADGLALGDGVLYVNSVTQSRLFSIAVGAGGAAGQIVELQPSMKISRPDGMRALGGNKFLLAENAAEVGRVSVVTVTGDKADIKVLKVDPGVTAMTRVGNVVWVDNAKFAYRNNGPMKDQSPEPFTIYAIPLN